jgi:hypothetical protein
MDVLYAFFYQMAGSNICAVRDRSTDSRSRSFGDSFGRGEAISNAYECNRAGAGKVKTVCASFNCGIESLKAI